ncbi:hypothetical protein [Desulfolutivibrio sulfoxidireducens]|uniref:hypothetical protein n=1 Tax=Desulfolutivibrio sulfoxidireducens TaxID=2773299 RepID=UPI001FE2476D|nr:hypothetical protein [Desulfolutivibrio sulfoxidireducens]
MFLTHHARPLASLVFLIVLPCLGCSSPDKNAPMAEGGLLDLAGWDIVGDGPVALNGQWEFYWDRLLAPDPFKSDIATPQPSGFMNLPGTWKGQELEGKTLPGQGQATFRLRLLPGPGTLRPCGLSVFMPLTGCGSTGGSSPKAAWWDGAPPPNRRIAPWS